MRATRPPPRFNQSQPCVPCATRHQQRHQAEPPPPASEARGAGCRQDAFDSKCVWSCVNGWQTFIQDRDPARPAYRVVPCAVREAKVVTGSWRARCALLGKQGGRGPRKGRVDGSGAVRVFNKR